MKKLRIYIIIFMVTFVFFQIAIAAETEPTSVVLNYVKAYSEKNVNLILDSLHPDFFVTAKNRFVSKYEKYSEENKRQVRALFKVKSNTELIRLEGREFYSKLLNHSVSDQYWKNFKTADLKLGSVELTEKTDTTATVKLPMVGKQDQKTRSGFTVFNLSKSTGSWLIKSLHKTYR